MESNKFNWKLLYSINGWIGATPEEKKKFIMTTLLFIAILFMAYGYWKQVKIIEDINNNPCKYVETIQTMCFNTNQLNIYNQIEDETTGNLTPGIS